MNCDDDTAVQHSITERQLRRLVMPESEVEAVLSGLQQFRSRATGSQVTARPSVSSCRPRRAHSRRK